MLKTFLSVAAVLTVVGCSNEKDASQLKLVDSDDMVLELNSGLYGETVSIDKARMSLNVDKTGQIDYTIRADMTIGDIANQTLTFKRIYRANPQIVSFAYFKKMESMKPVAYTEKGLHLANFTKVSETDKTVTLMFSHLPTGVGGTVTVSSGLYGIVSIESLELSGKSAVVVDDPQGRKDIEYTNLPYYPYYIQREVTKKLMGLADGTLSIKKIK
jgi:hypothetical protein